MKRVLILSILLCVGAPALRAQETKPVAGTGNWAILFTFSGLSTFGVNGLFTVGFPSSAARALLGDVTNGGAPSPQFLSSPTTTVPGVGMRYYLGDNLALRGGLGIGSSSQTTKNGNGIPDNSNSGFLFGIQAAAEYHLPAIGAVSPYLGGGLNVQFASVDAKAWQDAQTGQEGSESATTFGILGMAGFEWFCFDRVSIGGEYQLGFSSLSGTLKLTTTTGGTSRTTSSDLPTSTTFATSAFSVILSIYP